MKRWDVRKRGSIEAPLISHRKMIKTALSFRYSGPIAADADTMVIAGPDPVTDKLFVAGFERLILENYKSVQIEDFFVSLPAQIYLRDFTALIKPQNTGLHEHVK